MELGPRKLSGDFLGLAPPWSLWARALSIPLRSKGELAPLERPNGEAAWVRLVNRSKSSTSLDPAAPAPAGDHGSLAEAAVRTGGCGLHGSSAFHSIQLARDSRKNK